jgi:hypothetical protein
VRSGRFRIRRRCPEHGIVTFILGRRLFAGSQTSFPGGAAPGAKDVARKIEPNGGPSRGIWTSATKVDVSFGCGGQQRSERIQITLQVDVKVTVCEMGTLPEIEAYRRKLIKAFPPLPFDGLVSTHDECDDGIHLRRELSGKRWDELSHEILFHGSIGLPLLETSALIAFLPAWLLRSMETSDLDDPIVLEFTLYFLCPGNEDDAWNEKSLSERIGLFNSGQRDAVADFLRFVVSSAEGRDWKRLAEFGLSWWQPK